MLFEKTKLAGAYFVVVERLEDERGYFASTFVAEEFASHGLDACVAQTAISFNRKKGTLRGMHYQVDPHEQAKVVRCTRGAVYDVIIDLCPGSRTFRSWLGVDLSASDARMLYVPPGFAHGFLTLEDETELYYQISKASHPASERGVRWDDPAFGIEWPFPPTVLSERDRSFASLGQGAR